MGNSKVLSFILCNLYCPESVLLAAALFRSFSHDDGQADIISSAHDDLPDCLAALTPIFMQLKASFPFTQLHLHSAYTPPPARGTKRDVLAKYLCGADIRPVTIAGNESEQNAWVELFAQRASNIKRPTGTNDPMVLLAQLPYRDSMIEEIVQAAANARRGDFICPLSQEAKVATDLTQGSDRAMQLLGRLSNVANLNIGAILRIRA